MVWERMIYPLCALAPARGGWGVDSSYKGASRASARLSPECKKGGTLGNNSDDV